MTIASYSDVQTSVLKWIARTTDADLTAIAPDLITLFESAANRRLRVRQQELSTTLTPSSGIATLPSDYLAWRRVTWTGSTNRELEYVHPSYLHARYPTNPADSPNIFTIEGSSLTVRPSSDTALTFDYYQKIPALSNSNTTNWLLTAHPDVYLFGSLAEAHGFVKDPENLGGWLGRRDQIFDEIERLDARTRGQAAIRVMGATP
jgi:hypothetical protein